MLLRNAILMILLGVGSVLSVTDVGASEQVYYFHNDHLGTPQAMSDAAGRKVWEAEYEPFGKTTVNQDPDGDGQVVVNNLRFPGQYYDAETGLHYNYHRDYDPATGRYLQPDPIGLIGGMNPYIYVRANPVGRIDPYGLYDCVYDVSQHRMACEPNTPGNPRYDSTNWTSGNNQSQNCRDCRDNPNRDEIRDHGPIPDGGWDINAQRPGSSGRPLTPRPGTDAHGRSGFQTHGCADPNTCSEGCPAATTNFDRDEFNRLMSLEEGNNTMVVR